MTTGGGVVGRTAGWGCGRQDCWVGCGRHHYWWLAGLMHGKGQPQRLRKVYTLHLDSIENMYIYTCTCTWLVHYIIAQH